MSSTRSSQPAPLKIVVIGGGATGTGIARDAAQQGYEVVLIERGELGSGTSGSFHGILHSGGRYALNDPAVAAECYKENQLLRQIIPSAIRETGGIFIALSDQEARHASAVMQACETAGIPVKELTLRQALQAEPQLSHTVKRAFTVPDGSIDGAKLLQLNRQAGMQAAVPVSFLTDRVVIGFKKKANSITSVSVRNRTTGIVEHISCDYVINAAGVWAGEVTRLASIKLNMVFDKGTMMVFKESFSHAVLNRCRPEDDGDLLAPHGSQSIMGTTARVITDLNECYPTQEEIDTLLTEGAAMVPGLKGAEVTRIYAGVRPLISNGSAVANGSTRSISRSFSVVDHAPQGTNNFISVVGGKVTLYRLMAQTAVDLINEKVIAAHGPGLYPDNR